MTKLLPPNSTKFEINFESAFSRISDIENSTRKFNNPMTAQSQVLPWLAWEKSVDVWDKNWNEDQKRNAIAASYNIHAHKGTIGALEQAVDALGLNVIIREWFQTVPMLKPYTFEVFIEVSQIGITELQYEKLIDVVNANKNLRSHWKFANTFVISEAHAEIVNLPICCGHDFEYSETAGSDIFNVWSDWILKTPIMVKQGTAHYKAYKFDNVTTLESYANLDLTVAIVRSLHDSDMQQWQAVKDACNELTGQVEYFFDKDNERIFYFSTVDDPEHPTNEYLYRIDYGSPTIFLPTVSDVCRTAQLRQNPDRQNFEICVIHGSAIMLSYSWSLVGSVMLNPAYDPSAELPKSYKSFDEIAQKIISNTSSSNQGTSLLAEAYLENVAQSIFSTDESKQFVKLSDLTSQFEENKI